jgi:hypothetical protein
MTTIIAPGGTFTPKQLQIDTRNHKLYWSDREGMRVMRANVDGSNVETLVDTSDGDPRPGRDPTKWCVGVAVDAPGGKLYWSQKGDDNAGEGRICRADLELRPGETPSTRRDVEVLYEQLPDKAYARATAGSTDEHKEIPPELFTAETPLGTYQGMTDQVVMSRTPGSFRTVLVPHGSSKPEWLSK